MIKNPMYQQGFSDGIKFADKKLVPLVRLIRECVYDEAFEKGRKYEREIINKQYEDDCK